MRIGTALRAPAVPTRLMLVLGVLAASDGLYAQSTMGFSRQFAFESTAPTNNHWISIPWNYHPTDVGTVGVLDAEDLCLDLGGFETVGAVIRWNESTSTLSEHLCGTPSPFALSKGVGYGVRNAPGRDIQGAVVGAHDNSHSYSIAASGTSQLSWLSIPYHIRIPENLGVLLVTAEDLCRQVGASEILAIVRWNNAASVFEAYGCGSDLAVPFEIERGEAYGLVNRGTQAISWQPTHY